MPDKSSKFSKTDKLEKTQKQNQKKIGKLEKKLGFEKDRKKSSSLDFSDEKYIRRGITDGSIAGVFATRKTVNEKEDENVGIESIEGVTSGVNTVKHVGRGLESYQEKRQEKKLQKYLNQDAKLEQKIGFEKVYEDKYKPKGSNRINNYFYKKKIQREYNKEIRNATGTRLIRGFKETTRNAWNSIKLGSKKSSLYILGLLFLFFGIMALMHSCSSMIMGGLGSIAGSSYQADDINVTNADIEYTKLEASLLKEIQDIEINNPNYDEYRYNLSSVGHDPHELIAYLTALFQDFGVNDILYEIEDVFNSQYDLTTQDVIERYTTTRTVTDPDTGERVTVREVHEKKILVVTLNSRPLDLVLKERMNDEQNGMYNILMETKGNFMSFPSPIDGEWKSAITSMFGYRIHPISGEMVMHNGIDIAGDEGTRLKAIFDGIVVEVAFDRNGFGNYVIIEHESGAQVLYAHCSSVDVNVGDEVTRDDVIARMGSTGNSTGNHLHLELKEPSGERLNPYFYLHSEIDEYPLSASTYYNGYTGNYGNPGIAYDTETVRQLFNEAEKHIGKPYVYGANGPNAFDCSSFVAWSFRVSGVKPDLYRTTAQGIFNKTTPISRNEAKAGDIVFFTGTYNTSNPVSHVGIYAGNGFMLHAGDPIQYTSIDTNYWSNHFYAFGRLN